jgi:hypothetical protein
MKMTEPVPEAIAFLRDRYSPFGAQACPACLYVDGVFQRSCKLHEQLEAQNQQIIQLERTLKFARYFTIDDEAIDIYTKKLRDQTEGTPLEALADDCATNVEQLRKERDAARGEVAELQRLLTIKAQASGGSAPLEGAIRTAFGDLYWASTSIPGCVMPIDEMLIRARDRLRHDHEDKCSVTVELLRTARRELAEALSSDTESMQMFRRVRDDRDKAWGDITSLKDKLKLASKRASNLHACLVQLRSIVVAWREPLDGMRQHLLDHVNKRLGGITPPVEES